jgi:hypothetical protein
MPSENEPTTNPTAPPQAPDLDLFGEPFPDQIADDDDQPGQNQDAGLTLTGDEWAEIEEVWDERAARNTGIADDIKTDSNKPSSQTP